MDLLKKFKETLSSVLPIMAIVILLGLTAAPLDSATLLKFSLGGIFVIIGLTLFLLGVDIGIIPIGERTGAALTAKRSLPLLLIVSFFIGLIVTIAEPDVQVLASQIKSVASNVNKWVLVCMIAIGLGIFVVLGLLRTVLSLNLKWILIISYILVFVMAFFCIPQFQGVAFDAGGATTGPMTVPFIMALGVGVAAVRTTGNSSSNDGNSFGLTGVASIGPIAAVCLYGILLRFHPASSTQEVTSSIENTLTPASGIFDTFIQLIPQVFKEVSCSLLPLAGMFLIFQIFLLHMPPFQVRRMIKGILYSFVGLIIFLIGVNGGFSQAGNLLGKTLGAQAVSKGNFWIWLLTLTGVVFGAVVVCAEPAVWVLTEQVENVSGGTIKRKIMLIALSAGVALSIGVSMLRVLYKFSLWYALIPGYALALILTLFCPPLFTAIAFDSGGVASGPMTSTFILSFTLGAAISSGGNPATDAFGVIALVAMTPLIAIQILGIIYKIKTSKKEA